MGRKTSDIFSTERNVTDVTSICIHSAHFKIQTSELQENGEKETKLTIDLHKKKIWLERFTVLTTFKRRLRCFSFLSSIFGLQTVWTHSTYNSSTHVTTVRGGHDSRTFFCVAGTGSIFIDTVDGDGVNTIHITIVCTAVSRHTAISSCKRVDGTSFITTLGLNKWYKYISH